MASPRSSGSSASASAGDSGADQRRLRLELTSSPDDVARARHEIGRFALGVGLDQLEIGAIELAVGEACANVVRHAYGSHAGAMTLEAAAEGDRLVVNVLDDGAGIRSRISESGAGLGTAIMIALCDTLEVGAGPQGCGTRVTMTFAI